MAAGLCHECAPGGHSDLGLQAFGTGLVTDTCSTEEYALHEALACHCHMRAFRPDHNPMRLQAGAICWTRAGRQILGQSALGTSLIISYVSWALETLGQEDI